MKEGQKDTGSAEVLDAHGVSADDAAMQAALILGTAPGFSASHAAPPAAARRRQDADIIIIDPLPADLRPVPLDERWHETNKPVRSPDPVRGAEPVHQAPPAEAIQASPAQRAVAPPKHKPKPAKVIEPPRQPKMVITAVPDDDDYYEEVGNADDTAHEIRVHTPLSKIGTTIVYSILLLVALGIWQLGARYTITAINGSAAAFRLLKIDIVAWNTERFFLFEWIGTILGAIPLIGAVFKPLASLPKIWLIPIIITIGESAFWPRRRRLAKDLIWFWRPLKGDATWKHYVFLFFLAFDVISTCAGAIMDQTISGGKAPLIGPTQFDWSILFKATQGQIALGIALGVFCAVASERIASFTIRDTIGLWFPPASRVHRLFRPTAYVQYK